MTSQVQYIACFSTQVGVCMGVIAIMTGNPIFYCAGFTSLIIGVTATFIGLSKK
uniref:Uncharacterized protein n=1 Tax=viral metagenome TaxID=1070528 RepID=A0A6C0JN42_9ZZZZ